MRVMSSANGRILAALREHLDAAKTAILASAFVSSSGIELLLPSLRRLLERGGAVSLYVTFTGGAFTDPRFFEQISPLEKRFPGKIDVYLYPHATSLFHAKAFLFEREDGSWSGIVGSANLTHSALTGTNVEIAAVAAPMAHVDVETVRAEISRLREQKYFQQLTPQLYAQIGPGPDEDRSEADPSATRHAKGRRELVKSALANLKPTVLPPLPALTLPSTVYAEELCATGVGVATDDDLADLSVSMDLGVFVRAGVLAKETTKTIGFVSESTKKGHSFSLIDAEVRAMVSTARKSIGKTIGLRAVDFGYLRWAPHRLYADVMEAVGAKIEVQRARDATSSDNPAIANHLDKLRRDFVKNMKRVVESLKLQPKNEWIESALSSYGISTKAAGAAMREHILAHIVQKNRSRISEPLVRSQLSRLTFAPRSFAFPLAQSLGEDVHYGHKHFLAKVLWACTDRLLKHSTDEGGTGALFQYLDARRQLNAGRHGLDASELAERAAAWLTPATTLDTVVNEFRQAFGPASFTWEVGDLVSMLPAKARGAR